MEKPTINLNDEASVIAVMPPSARDLVNVLGFAATMDLLNRFGGKRIFIPNRLTDDAKIVGQIGREAAEKLVERMPGTRMEPPMLTSIERLLRDNAIRADFDSGMDIPELVDRYRITQRHIRRLLCRSPDTRPSARPKRPRDPYTRDLFAAWGFQ